jgi:hypothetical protein
MALFKPQSENTKRLLMDDAKSIPAMVWYST